jgi:hypothetical protein
MNNKHKEKYLISKGWEGFGDRLQCLSHCLVMALRHNRTLYVDWTDKIWNEGFYRYFHFDNVASVEYLHQVQQHETTDNVYPKHWQHKLMLPANSWVYDIKDQLIFDSNKEYNFHDIWVHCGIGYREFNMVLLAKHLKVNKDIVPLITYDIGDLPVVHLRGTDRKHQVSDLNCTLNELYLKAPMANVISDDNDLIEQWMKLSPSSIVVSNPTVNINHYSIMADKHAYNIALLKEFFILASAKEAYALNEKSVYFEMARMLGQCNDYKSMFHYN